VSSTQPIRKRLSCWIGESPKRKLVSWMTIIFVVLVALSYTSGIGHSRAEGSMCNHDDLNPVFWWPYHLTHHYSIYCGSDCLLLHGELISFPAEYILSIIWWLLVALLVSEVILLASGRKKLSSRKERCLWISFGFLLCATAVLAHAHGIGQGVEGCDIACPCLAGVYQISLNWVFWWPYHLAGSGCFCGGGPLDGPVLYQASVLWWMLVAYALPRGTSLVFDRTRRWLRTRAVHRNP